MFIPDKIDAAFSHLVATNPLVDLPALYAGIVKASNRRTLGTFFTPSVDCLQRRQAAILAAFMAIQAGRAFALGT